MISSSEPSQYQYFSVQGMHCVKCIRKMQAVGNSCSGLHSLDVDLSQNTLKAKVSEQFQTQFFIDKVEKAGFVAKLLTDPIEEKFSYKSLLIRLGVAGACAGNIMLISVSGYFGANVGFFRNFFNLVKCFIISSRLFVLCLAHISQLY